MTNEVDHKAAFDPPLECGVMRGEPRKDPVAEKWVWMMDFCKAHQIPPAQTWAWELAEKEFTKAHNYVMAEINEWFDFDEVAHEMEVWKK